MERGTLLTILTNYFSAFSIFLKQQMWTHPVVALFRLTPTFSTIKAMILNFTFLPHSLVFFHALVISGHPFRIHLFDVITAPNWHTDPLYLKWPLTAKWVSKSAGALNGLDIISPHNNLQQGLRVDPFILKGVGLCLYGGIQIRP